MPRPELLTDSQRRWLDAPQAMNEPMIWTDWQVRKSSDR